MLFVIYLNKIMILIGAVRMPHLYPELWKQSILHIPNALYYSVISVCTLLQIATVVISGLDMGLPTVLTAVCIMAVFSICAILRVKYVHLDDNPQ